MNSQAVASVDLVCYEDITSTDEEDDECFSVARFFPSPLSRSQVSLHHDSSTGFLCEGCKILIKQHITTTMNTTPLKLTHIATMICFQMMHPLKKCNINSFWLAKFSDIVTTTTTRFHMLCFGKYYFTTALSLLAHVLAFKRRTLGNPYERRSSLGEIKRSYRALRQLHTVEATCCCCLYPNCMQPDDFVGSRCTNFWDVFYTKFHKFNTHKKYKECCDGYVDGYDCPEFNRIAYKGLMSIL